MSLRPIPARPPARPTASSPASGRGAAAWTRSVGSAIGEFFALDDPWVRRGPTGAERRRDVWIAVGMFAATVVLLELTHSMGGYLVEEPPRGLQYLSAAAGALPLVWRRSHPLLVMGLLQAHMFVAGVWTVAVMSQSTMLVVYFLGLVTGVAWARDRRALIVLLGVVLTFMFGWMVWQYVFGTSVEDMYRDMNLPVSPDRGLFSLTVANVLYSLLFNVAFYGGAILWGQSSWRAAKHLATVSHQAETIREQATELRDHAVMQERLRIARELHDVVAHHVSVMGVQASAARRVLRRDPEAAAQALGAVEQSSRQAVGEMRSLLGALRGDDVFRAGRGPGVGVPPRSPEPSLGQLPDLVAQAAAPGFDPTYELVEQSPAAAEHVSPALGTSIYRIVQEALSNVRRHSTARRAVVVVRVDERHVEAEVVDDGRPNGTTSGSGLGLLGMRERVASHHGTVELGPRLVGGYRVRVRFPLSANAAPRDKEGFGVRSDARRGV